MSALRLLAILTLLPLLAVFATASAHEPLVEDQCGVERAEREHALNADLERCADAGEPRAQAALGFLYWGASRATYCRAGVCTLDDPSRRGLDASLTLEQLQVEGLRLIEAASRSGVAEVQNELGAAYLDGEFGLAVDYAAARSWLEMATEGGDAIAPYSLSRIYFGGFGVEQSNARAEQLLRLSAERRYQPAQCSLIRWLSQYSDRRRQREADDLRASLRRERYRCDAIDFIREMPLISTDETL